MLSVLVQSTMKEIWDNFADKGLRDSWTDYYINMLQVQRSKDETSTVEAFKNFYLKYFDEDQIASIFYYAQLVYEYDEMRRNYLWRVEFIEAFKDVGYDIQSINHEIDAYKRCYEYSKEKLKEMMNDEDFIRYINMYGIYEKGFQF